MKEIKRETIKINKPVYIQVIYHNDGGNRFELWQHSEHIYALCPKESFLAFGIAHRCTWELSFSKAVEKVQEYIKELSL